VSRIENAVAQHQAVCLPGVLPADPIVCCWGLRHTDVLGRDLHFFKYAAAFEAAAECGGNVTSVISACRKLVPRTACSRPQKRPSWVSAVAAAGCKSSRRPTVDPS